MFASEILFVLNYFLIIKITISKITLIHASVRLQTSDRIEKQISQNSCCGY